MPLDLYEIQIPFGGFYGSIHEDGGDRILENIADNYKEDTGNDIPDALMENFNNACDWSAFHRGYAQAYAAAFAEEHLTGSAEFSGMISPKFYNFETDRIFMQVSGAFIEHMMSEVPEKVLTAAAKERHTSYDGFWSHYSPEWKSWGPLLEWDHNQLHTLLMAYLFEERGEAWDQWAEHYLLEDGNCNGEYEHWLWGDSKEATRAFAIYDHLRNRANRPIKTMVAWYAANQKPWNTTPLGSQHKHTGA
jgi:hypothetical protein